MPRRDAAPEPAGMVLRRVPPRTERHSAPRSVRKFGTAICAPRGACLLAGESPAREVVTRHTRYCVLGLLRRRGGSSVDREIVGRKPFGRSDGAPSSSRYGMVDGLNNPEDNIACCIIGQRHAAFPGSESTAWDQSKQVNVGGPERSAKESSIDEQVRWVRTSRRCSGSQMGHSTDEAG
jgi:hypothetical protein